MEGGKFLECHWEYDFGPNRHIELRVKGIHNEDTYKEFWEINVEHTW